VEDEIRQPHVADLVSQVSSIKELRQKLVAIQRKIGGNGGIVMDGRDIGSVVFPNAELKLFVTASEEIRAQRRFDELKDNGTSISLESVKENLSKRDYQDTHRKESPLIQVKDAIVVDNSNLSREEQLEWVLEKVNKIL
jgi:cytidylate kinase